MKIRPGTALEAFQDLPHDAREDAIALLTGISDPSLKNRLVKILAICRRDRRKRETDREGDRSRRTLVGSHVPRWRADRYKDLAEAVHMSLHAWVLVALEAQAMRQGAGSIRSPIAPRERSPRDPILAPDGSILCDREECEICPHFTDEEDCRIRITLSMEMPR